MAVLTSEFKAYSLALVVALAAGCNSSGGGGDDGEDGNDGGNGSDGGGSSSVGGDTLPKLNGLTGVPDNDNWLYFTSDADGNSGLFAYNPQLPDDGAVLVDGDAYLEGAIYLFRPIAQASITGNDLTDYRAQHLFYRSQKERTITGSDVTYMVPDAFQRVEATQSVTPPAPQQVSSEADNSNLNSTRLYFQYDLDQPANTAVAYLGGTTGWQQLRIGDSVSQAPLAFSNDHNPVVPLGDGNPNGWLVIDESNNNRLAQVDLNLASEGAVLDAQGNPVENVRFVDMFSHLGRDQQLLVLTFEDLDTSDEEVPPSELWLYSAGNPGTIKPLLNDQGEKLTFLQNLLGTGAMLPTADQLAIRDQTLYFAFHERSEFSILGAFNPMLYRVDSNGWSLEIDYASRNPDSVAQTLASPFLIDGGNELIWLIDDTLTSVDLSDYSESALYEGSIETPVVDSVNGWFFYNDTRNIDTAVAARVDGSEQIRLEQAQWIGASGTGEGNVAIRLARANISEVFLLKDDSTLAAVSAGSPDQGLVELGRLDPAPETVRVFGIRSGPHQLLRVGYEDDSYEVVYVNTEEADSLKHLMAAPSSQANAAAWTRPVYGR
ncbi:hypothetical protein [Saccharospirillum salsuginis]|uniref:Uncharacterized protein n=1 Tax=Saccharospirillum salsuginis TaxID=418750 RepID=A0A918N614_9GAMM|nr:hypothetical protein [Saccharospirillum salsuginis]GGX40997.1 hypothetical protein GCM10007392_04760 [Saccharospirillum salsuginis]